MEDIIWHSLRNKEKPPLGEVVMIGVLLLDDISSKEIQGVNTNEGIKLIESIDHKNGYVLLDWRYKTTEEKNKRAE